MDVDKVKCIMEWPNPKSVKDVKGFLGLTRYYAGLLKIMVF